MKAPIPAPAASAPAAIPELERCWVCSDDCPDPCPDHPPTPRVVLAPYVKPAALPPPKPGEIRRCWMCGKIGPQDLCDTHNRESTRAYLGEADIIPTAPRPMVVISLPYEPTARSRMLKRRHK